MIVAPSNKEQWVTMASFMHEYAHVNASPDTKFVAWVENNQLKLVVAFNAFLGKTCQMHVAMAKGFHFTPRKMSQECFRYAFDVLKVEKLLGIVNSKNERAMKYDEHIGFKEEFRMHGLHDDGGDIVLFSMTRDQCKYIKELEAA